MDVVYYKTSHRNGNYTWKLKITESCLTQEIAFISNITFEMKITKMTFNHVKNIL